jgi:Tfp pilus assembly protein PilF
MSHVHFRSKAWSFRAFILALAFALPLALPSTVRAEDAQEPPSLSDDTSDALQKVQPLLDAKNWSAALGILDTLMPTLDKSSYDLVVCLDIKARIYLQMDDLADVVGPWEKSLMLSDQHKYFSSRNTLDIVDGLGRVYYALSGTVKDPQLQEEYLDKAIVYMKRWLDDTPKPTEDAELGYAEVLYNKATANLNNIDQNLLNQALEAVHKGMLMSVHPKDGFYQVLIAALQLRGDYVQLTKYLELLVTREPRNRGYWEVLVRVYMNLAATNEKEPAKARAYFARAINAMERAQALGLLKSPQDNLNLASMYYEAGQFGKFTELLDAGLSSGGIQSTVENWSHLAYCYQLVGNNAAAIDALKRAEDVFPDNGDLDFKIGQIYSQMENDEAAYNAIRSAVSKGHLDKPYQVYVFLAYNAYQLKKFGEAQQAAEKASHYPEAAKDKELPRLRRAIEEEIAAQQAADEAKAAKEKAAAQEGENL